MALMNYYPKVLPTGLEHTSHIIFETIMKKIMMDFKELKVHFIVD
jgi:hypothetical protein